MKYIITAIFLGLITATAYADRSGLTVDAYGVRVQGFASNGADDIALTVVSRTVDMRNEVAWAAYSPGACKFRTMSTTTKAGGLQRTLPATTWVVRNVHPKSQFLNFSGCTNGELQRQ